MIPAATPLDARSPRLTPGGLILFFFLLECYNPTPTENDLRRPTIGQLMKTRKMGSRSSIFDPFTWPLQTGISLAMQPGK